MFRRKKKTTEPELPNFPLTLFVPTGPEDDDNTTVVGYDSLAALDEKDGHVVAVYQLLEVRRLDVTKILVTLLLALCLSMPAWAQQSVVEQARADLAASGFNVNRDAACVDFEITKIVAGRLADQGAGLLMKDCCGDFTDPNRTHCEYKGQGYSHDIVAYPNGVIVDIAIGDGRNSPSWQVQDADPSLISRYRSATSLGLTGRVDGVPAPTPAPVPVPTPTPQPLPVIDYSGVLQRILDSQQQLLQAQSELLTVSKDTNQHVVNIDRTFAQTLGHFSAFVGKYIAPAIGGYLIAQQTTK